MSDVVIRVEGLGKKFKLGTSEPYYRLSEAIVGLARHAAAFPKRLFSSSTSSDASNNIPAHAPNEFWALKDINFEVKRGDVVGIIGRNGAGKSTLLKILSQITEPTEGRFGIKGRVASLLEVGTGFHPELTGRENIFLSGSILGMSKFEIKRKFDEITNFAGTDKFLDTPVKRYSSGMQVRLGFAIAAHLEPEILIVDEVLAVGDAEFQKKCVGKMGEVSKSGRTILFVSHNLAAVRSMCNKSLLLQNGIARFFGDTDHCLKEYSNSFRQPIQNHAAHLGSQIHILNAYVDLPDERLLTTDDRVTLKLVYRVSQPQITISIGLAVYREGELLFSSVNRPGASETPDPFYKIPMDPCVYICDCTLPGYFLNDGDYFITFRIYDNSNNTIAETSGIQLTIHDSATMRDDYLGIWQGMIRPQLSWNTYRQDHTLAENNYET